MLLWQNRKCSRKKARFHRGKKQAAESGKHNGGTVAFGYSVDENRFLIINESEAETVRLTFELMASGKYTKAGVTNELRARGVMAYDRLITYQFVVSILNNTAYIGYRNKYAFNKKYPRIISDELFNMAHDVMRSNNSTKAKATKHYNFAALLIKCPDCGRHYIAHGEKYVCSGWNAPTIRTAMGQDRCNNNIIIRQKHLDGMLWSIATRQHYNYIKGLDEQQKKDILHQIEILKQKQTESNKRIDETVERYERVDDVYMSGRMTKEKYQKQIQLISDDEKTLRNEIAQYDEEIARLNAMLSDSGKDEFSAWFDNNYMLNDVISTDDEKTMYDIVHKYIIGVELERAEIPECSVVGEIIVNGKAVKPSFKLTGRKALKVTVRCYNDETVTVCYIPNLRGTDKKIVTITDGLAEPFDYEPILRDDNGNVTTVIATLAKALNNAIIEHLSNDATADDFITLIDSIKKYDCAYMGDFDEAGELAQVAKAFNALHKQRNFIATVRTLSAAAKKYNVNSDDMTTHILSTLKV